MNRKPPARRETVLVVEDERDIREIVEYNLSREGYRVIPCADGEEALALAAREAPDLVLLDLMLPGLDGLEVCRRLKTEALTRAIPVVMATAKGEESDIVLGLGIGADDYVAKPFSPRELVARVKAVLRRGPLREERAAGARLERGPLVVDADRHQATVDGAAITLTATEFRLLHFLASYPGRVFTRDHLLTRVIGEETMVIDRNIDVHVRAVRRKLGARRSLIETVRGVGYRFREA